MVNENSTAEVTESLSPEEKIILLEKQLKSAKKEAKMFSQLLKGVNAAIIKLSKNGSILYANGPFLDLIKEPYSQIKGKRFETSMFCQLVEDENDIQAFINQMSEKTIPEASFISKNKNKSGNEIWIWWTVKPKHNYQGVCKAYIITGINISKRKEYENEIIEKNKQITNQSKELIKSELRFRNMSESIPFGIFVCDSSGGNEYVNKEYCRLTGLSFNEALGDGWLKAIHPDDYQKVKTRWEKGIQKSPVNYNIKYQIKNIKNNKIIKAHAVASEMLNDENLVGYVGIVEDITRKEKLLDKLKNYELIIRNSNEQMSLISKDFKYLVVNDSYVHAHDMKKHEIEGIKVENLWGRELFESKILNRLEKALQGKQVRYQDWFYYKNIGNKYMDVSYQPVFGSRGKVEAITVNTSDITDLKNTQLELEKAKNEAEKANKAKTEFLANMSHEIRTPLNSVIGFTELLEQQISDRNQQKYLKSIKTGGRALLTIINDILDLSKIEAGKMELKYEPFNIQMLTDEIKQIFSIQFEKKNLSFETFVSPSLPDYILLDEIRIRQILFNLVGNAVKFTEKGGVMLSIEAFPKSNHLSSIKIVVRDSGIGIPADQQLAVFSAFKQQAGQNTRRFGGTGLGLTISKKLVEAMNGNIFLESVENEFTRFTIIFENVQTEQKSAREHASLKSEKVKIVFEKANLLLIDKDTDNHQLIKEIFIGTELNIIAISTIDEGIKLLNNNKIDLILLDINIKDSDAHSFLKLVKKNKSSSKIPIIGLSTGIINLKEIKFDSWIAKPINRIELISVLSNYLKNKQMIEIEKENSLDQLAINDENILLHPEIKSIKKELIKKIIPEWKKVVKEELSDGIEKFSLHLNKFAAKYNLNSLHAYSVSISEHLSSFDLEELSNTLKRFPDIIKNIIEEKHIS